MSDLKYWIGFHRIPGIGRVRFARLEKHFGDLEQAWRAGPEELRRAGLDAGTITKILAQRPKISPDAELEQLEKHGVKALTWRDPEFPERLKEIYDVPPVLYVRGSLLPEDSWSITVVGTRRASLYGREVAERIVEDLSRSRITVVSGLARGVDTIAHRTALKSEGRTLAVLACGLDRVYPAENLRLAQEIMERGALLSDYPLGTQPRAENFPRRNRIMSGLSLGVLVVEAGEGSGALITANLALEQNREVFAVPGSVLSPQSRGTNRLIQEGAKLVQDTQDILEELNLTLVPQQREMVELLPADETETKILRDLSQEPIHIDEISQRCRLSVSLVSSALAVMELKGMVKQVGAMHYIRARETEARYQVRA